jgi:UrcA family protein
MTKGRLALLSAAMIAALTAGIGAASAQYYGPPDSGPRSYGPPDRAYDDRASDDRVYGDTERVIVRPDYDYIRKHQVLGRVNGEVNPTAYSLSRPVDLADLDLSRASDRQEMRNRVYETAVNLCYELDDRVPGLRADDSGDRECVRTATRNAIRDVMDSRY